MAEMKPCPLCGTPLPLDKWLEVVGVYDAQQKYREQLEQRLNKVKAKEQKFKKKEKEMRTKLRAEKKKNREMRTKAREKEQVIKSKLKQRFESRQERFKRRFKLEREKLKREKAAAERKGIVIGSRKAGAKLKKLKEKEVREKTKLEREHQRELKRAQRKSEVAGIEKGIEKQKARTKQVSERAEKYRKERDKLNDEVKRLEEMVKKGTTPQIEGLAFEHELADQLRLRFPDDEITPTGRKKGDIIQTVRTEGKTIGKIIYECKKTKEFQNKFIAQIRRDKGRVTADYGVIVTWATKEDKRGFWLEGDIVIVHPLGALDVASFLREILVQMYSLKLSKPELETKGRAILEFMQSEKFRSRIQDSIAKSREAYEILKKEAKTHISSWRKRAEIYQSIHINTGTIQNTVRYILLHGEIPGESKIREKPLEVPLPVPMIVRKKRRTTAEN